MNEEKPQAIANLEILCKTAIDLYKDEKLEDWTVEYLIAKYALLEPEKAAEYHQQYESIKGAKK